MSDPRCLPQEIHDHIVDFLRHDTKTLKKCCLVSKSWVSRTREHLFAHITFHPGDHLKWSKTFPDPTNSPARHTRALVITEILEDAEEINWVQGFSRVERLRLMCPSPHRDPDPLVPYRKFAPPLKSLSVSSEASWHPHVFDLVRFLPLLEDLALRGSGGSSQLYKPSTDVSPQTSPALTGTLELRLSGGTASTIRQVLGLPNHLRFRSLRLLLFQPQDLPSVTELVTACSNTLEHLNLIDSVRGQNTLTPIDISKATRLRDVTFRCGSWRSAWIVLTLNTVVPEHRNLQRISIYIPPSASCGFTNPGERAAVDRHEEANPNTGWSQLDHILIQFWEARSIRSTIVLPRSETGRGMVDWAAYLLPEMTWKEIIDFDEYDE